MLHRLGLKPRTSLSHSGPGAPSSTLHPAPCPKPLPLRGWTSASLLQPDPCTTQSFSLCLSLGQDCLLVGGCSLAPSPSFPSWSGLVCRPCSVWTLPSACFLPYVYSKNLLHTGVVKTSFYFIVFIHCIIMLLLYRAFCSFRSIIVFS